VIQNVYKTVTGNTSKTVHTELTITTMYKLSHFQFQFQSTPRKATSGGYLLTATAKELRTLHNTN